MIIVLNGPLGIGKSTLAEALCEAIDGCVMLDGDHLVAANPSPGLGYLHAIITLLVEHHRRFGYRHVVINHSWTTAEEFHDLHRRLAQFETDADIHYFLLTLPVSENLRRIERRARARALNEREFERQTFAEERNAFGKSRTDLGEPFDVSAPPLELVDRMLCRLGLS
jgi:thymidylate kinase